MYWLVKNKADSGAGHKLALPEALAPEARFPALGVSAQWHKAQRTLTLTDERGLERHVRVRAAAVQSVEGEAESEVSVEYIAGAAKGVQSLTATVAPWVPGQAGRGRSEAGKALHLRSQITGKVLRVLVKPGDRVEGGQTLLIVEAMKMENRVFAPFAAVVALVHVKEGESVATGKELVRLGPP